MMKRMKRMMTVAKKSHVLWTIYSDALGLLGQLHSFASQKDGNLLPGINRLTYRVEQKILEKRRQSKQTFITDFSGSTQIISN